jgi:hypothetical protein
MNLSLSCKSVNVESNNYYKVDVEINDVEISDILDQIEIDDAIRHYDEDKVLEEIGIERVKEYFSLVEPGE